MTISVTISTNSLEPLSVFYSNVPTRSGVLIQEWSTSKRILAWNSRITLWSPTKSNHISVLLISSTAQMTISNAPWNFSSMINHTAAWCAPLSIQPTNPGWFILNVPLATTLSVSHALTKWRRRTSVWCIDTWNRTHRWITWTITVSQNLISQR